MLGNISLMITILWVFGLVFGYKTVNMPVWAVMATMATAGGLLVFVD